MIALSVISTRQAVARQRPLASRRATCSGSVHVVQVAHGEVHGDVEPVPLAPPARHLAERLVEHVARQRLDQAGLLGSGHELVRPRAARASDAASSSAPRRRRPRPCARRSWAGTGATSSRLRIARGSSREQREARRVVAVELGAYTACGVAVSFATYIATSARWSSTSASRAVRRAARDPDAGLDVQRQAVDVERLLERGRRIAPAPRRARPRRRRAAHEDAELVPAEPRDGVAPAQHRLQPVRELDAAAGRRAVAEGVVDLLEAVEIHEQHRDCEPSFSATPIACSTSCPKQARLGRPVRSSCSAWWRLSRERRRSSTSSRLRSVMSRQMPWTPIGRPSCSTTRLETSRTTDWPSRAMNSCSNVVPERSPESLRSVSCCDVSRASAVM